MRSLFLPIDALNLAHYLQGGLIKPAGFFRDRTPDVQTKVNSALLLMDARQLSEHTCSLRLVVSEATDDLTEIAEGFYVLNGLLPISRLREILLFEGANARESLYNIRRGAAHVPEWLINLQSSGVDIAKVPEQLKKGVLDNSDDLKASAKLFDETLGGLVFLYRLGRIDTEKHTPSFFAVLGTLNDRIQSQVIDSGISTKSADLAQLLKPLPANSFNARIHQPVTDNVVAGYAESEGFQLTKRFNKFDLNSINTATKTYPLAILATYGINKPKKIEDFLLDYKNGLFPETRREGIAFTMGINHGYFHTRNDHNVGSTERVSLKFSLDSQFDFFLIESAFQGVCYAEPLEEIYEDILASVPHAKTSDRNAAEQGVKILDRYFVIDGALRKVADIERRENRGRATSAELANFLIFIASWLNRLGITIDNKVLLSKFYEWLDDAKNTDKLKEDVSPSQTTTALGSPDAAANKAKQEAEHSQPSEKSSLLTANPATDQKSLTASPSSNSENDSPPVADVSTTLFGDVNKNGGLPASRYHGSTLKDLKNRAAELDIRGRSSYTSATKGELIERILKAEKTSKN